MARTIAGRVEVQDLALAVAPVALVPVGQGAQVCRGLELVHLAVPHPMACMRLAQGRQEQARVQGSRKGRVQATEMSVMYAPKEVVLVPCGLGLGLGKGAHSHRTHRFPKGHRKGKEGHTAGTLPEDSCRLGQGWVSCHMHRR